MAQSDAVPPRMQASEPPANGSADSQATSPWERCRCLVRKRGNIVVKKLPENPVKPYIRHSDQTLVEPSILRQGTRVGAPEISAAPLR